MSAAGQNLKEHFYFNGGILLLSKGGKLVKSFL